MFGLLGYDVLNNIKADFGAAFVNHSLNFRSLIYSWVTLFAIGTGNYYSEIISKVAAGQGLGITVFMHVYILVFYIFFYLTLKSFTIQIIIRYETYFGSDLGIARQQINQFKYSWKRAKLTLGRMKYKDFTYFLGEILPPPLGCAGQHLTHMELSRFVKKVLLCMPCDAARCNDTSDNKIVRESTSRHMFPADLLPNDIR